MLKKILTVAIVVLMLAACGTETPSARLNGQWKVDIEKTLVINNEFFKRSRTTKQEFAKEVAKGELSFDVKNQEFGISGDKKEKYTVIKEEKDEVRIKLVRADLDLKINFNDKGEITIVYTNDKYMPNLVLVRSK